MADLNRAHAEPAECWPKFDSGQVVVGWKLLDFVDWVDRSKDILETGSDPGPMPVIALPPVQRSAVWRPKQVLDLWDSLMRGLPIGTFYLAWHDTGPRDVVRPGTNETIKISAKGFDLLDGQQRLRALMVGILGPADEKRCLWVDLGAKDTGPSPCLLLTSQAQPFGYDPKTGNKLHVDHRRKAREQVERDAEDHGLLHADGVGGLRRAYDLELFEGAVTQDGRPLQPQPPLPYGTTKGQVFKLQALFETWRNCASRQADQGVAALRSVTENAPALEKPLLALHKAFCNVESAQVALLKVDPSNFQGGDQDLLALFARIGAGGTPLSREEQLYSIYKHHVPQMRDAVEAIHRKAGRVLSPIKIVTTALRIANARADELRTNTPDPIEFTKAMTSPENKLRMELKKLLPESLEPSGSLDGTLSQSFVTMKSLLSYEDGVGSFWLPDVLLTLLPAEFWQVLVFWATSHPKAAERERCRQEAVRFALFWRLCVLNDEKAANAAFAFLKRERAKHATFPGAALYQLLTGAGQSEKYAHALLPPCEFERKLCQASESPTWRTDEERFVENKLRNDVGSNWWWHGRKMLPWLQRDYIKDAFPGYVPLSDHEDDLPYDFDHICPYKDWGDWVSVRNRLESIDGGVRQRMRDGRWGVGNGIGNLRIVDSSINRADQDDDIARKMPFAVAGGEPSDSDRAEMAKLAFPPEDRALWKKVSRTGAVSERRWNDDRLAAFQRAVEQRAAWLYRRFFDDLGYEQWVPEQSQGDRGQ